MTTSGHHRLDGELLRSGGVGPGDDPDGVWAVGQGPVDGRGELLVADDGIDVLARNHLGECRSREGRVEQQDVRADPVGGDQRLDEATVVARHDPDDARGTAGHVLQRGREGIGALVDVAPRQRAELVHQAGPVGAALGALAKPEVMPMFSRAMAAAIRRYCPAAAER